MGRLDHGNLLAAIGVECVESLFRCITWGCLRTVKNGDPKPHNQAGMHLVRSVDAHKIPIDGDVPQRIHRIIRICQSHNDTSVGVHGRNAQDGKELRGKANV
jgi:hypothetical protein